jgi:cytochrome c
MRVFPTQAAVCALSLAFVSSVSSGVAAAADDEAANASLKKGGCVTCHATDKDKVGPSFKKVAAKYKGQADAEGKVVQFITTGSKVKMASGSEIDHKALGTKDAKELKNVAQFILAQ